MRNSPTAPFEMVEFKFHIRITMDAWRQMIRHRTASVNEYSTRYSEAINAVQNRWLGSKVKSYGIADNTPYWLIIE